MSDFEFENSNASDFPEEWTAEECVKRGNALARTFYSSMGYQTPEGYRFDKAHHPQERGCWNLAVYAFDALRDTDLNECLNEIGDDE